MKKSYYTYYSYEEFGRGYIGKKTCDCKPEEDVDYFGSYTDETFDPTQKIILDTYDSPEELAKAEEILHAFFDVTPNPHFVNKHNANGKFYATPEESSKRMKEYWKTKTPEQRSEISKKRLLNTTPEQRSEAVRKGRANMTPEQRSEISKKRLLNTTPEQRSESAKKDKQV